MRNRLLLIGAFFLISAPAALANPVDPDSFRGLTEVNISLLIVEALVVACLLAWRKFRFSRVFFTWLAVTMVTYWYMAAGLRLDLMFAGSGLTYWLIVLLFEIIAVLVEAWVIARMAESRFFREPQTAFPYGWAVAVSIAGNAASFGLSLLGS